MISERIVFVEPAAGGSPIPAGLFSLDPDTGVGTFQYGRRYLLRPDALPLDPVNLPLSPQRFVTRKNKGLFGPLRDVLPDSWGRYLIAKQQKIPFASLRDAELLDQVTTSAVGCISFGKSPERSDSRREPPVALENLDQVAGAFSRALDSGDLPEEVRYLLQYGTSLGGAQPKCPVLVDGEEWIAKFENRTTPVPFPKIEFATMQLARLAGIDTPAHRLHRIAGSDIYLVKRFDRIKNQRLPFISTFALSDLDLDEIDRGSYVEVADRMRQFVSDVRRDHHELFRRIAFNILIRNEDDHLRNHGFVHHHGAWQLSPAYDLLPMPARRREQDSFHLALAVGESGSLATPQNLLSQCLRFSLTPAEAATIWQEVRETVGHNWQQTLTAAGVAPEHIEAVRWCFERFTCSGKNEESLNP